VAFHEDVTTGTEADAASRRADRELGLREREVAIKEKEANVSKWRNPLAVGIVVAAAGLAGNTVVAWFNYQNAKQVEHLHAQSTLIVEAVRTNGDLSLACKNLTFFLNLGLLDDPEKTIRAACPSAYTGPPTLPADSLPGALTYGGFAPQEMNLSVRVLDEQSNPIPSAEIVLEISSVKGCTTGKDGTCAIKLPLGTFSVLADVRASGYKDSGIISLPNGIVAGPTGLQNSAVVVLKR
jgi:hypothetical protein